MWNSPLAEFDSLVRRAFGPSAFSTTRPTGFRPAADVDRDGDDAVVRLELPGIDVSQDVTVEVANGQLVVRGERRDERSEDRDGQAVREVRYGSFRRQFTLPSHVSADAVSAGYDAGVLSIRIAGAYAGQTAHRVEISGPPAEQE
ncbi:MAG TPA: Hsp20/alpha crystallin family protein [Mycobacteriales bacterium]|nr:Hsp20/alpha crystallin family protein [Mycobacteriales bacterium]